MDPIISTLLLSTALIVISIPRIRRYFYFLELCFGLNGSLQKTGDKNLLRYAGKFKERDYTINYRYRFIRFLSESVSDELEVQVPILQKFWLRLLPQRTDVDNPTEIEINCPEIDERYLIHTNQPEAAREYLSTSMIQDSLRMLPIFPDRIEFYRGKVTLTISNPSRKKPHASEIQRTMFQVVKLVLFYEQQKTEIFRIAQSSSTSVCPFCRGEMQSSVEIIVRCSVCSTLLHSSCWAENGQCTTWGCHSSANVPERRL